MRERLQRALRPHCPPKDAHGGETRPLWAAWEKLQPEVRPRCPPEDPHRGEALPVHRLWEELQQQLPAQRSRASPRPAEPPPVCAAWEKLRQRLPLQWPPENAHRGEASQLLCVREASLSSVPPSAIRGHTRTTPHIARKGHTVRGWRANRPILDVDGSPGGSVCSRRLLLASPRLPGVARDSHVDLENLGQEEQSA